MIEYTDNDWEQVKNMDQLSEGETYFVCVGEEVIGLADYGAGEFSCEQFLLNLHENIPDDLYVIPLIWPKAKEGDNVY